MLNLGRVLIFFRDPSRRICVISLSDYGFARCNFDNCQSTYFPPFWKNSRFVEELRTVMRYAVTGGVTVSLLKRFKTYISLNMELQHPNMKLNTR